MPQGLWETLAVRESLTSAATAFGADAPDAHRLPGPARAWWWRRIPRAVVARDRTGNRFCSSDAVRAAAVA
ncbi:hypothetical protein [Streptomyces sp. NPDC002540]